MSMEWIPLLSGRPGSPSSYPEQRRTPAPNSCPTSRLARSAGINGCSGQASRSNSLPRGRLSKRMQPLVMLKGRHPNRPHKRIAPADWWWVR